MNYTKGECDCKVVSGFLCGNVIEYCPLHKAAPDLYEALEGLLQLRDIPSFIDVRVTIEDIHSGRFKEADKALAKAEVGNDTD